MKKAVLALTIIFTLLLSAAAGIQLTVTTTVQTQTAITIEADGSINPPNAPLKRLGNVYSLTSDIVGSITVNASNIVLNGNKHHMNVPSLFYGIKLNAVTNVAVTDFIILGGAKGIDITGTSNLIANNTIKGTDNWIHSLSLPTAAIMLNNAKLNTVTGNNLENNRVGINLVSWNPKQCSNNRITANNFINCSTAILIYDSSNNRFYLNNFLNNKILLQDTGYYGHSLPSFNVWDDGQQFGNYWSDYQTRYPNAKEIKTSGVGDTPYFVKPNNYVDPATLTRKEAKDHWTEINAQYQRNTDYYPLMRPLDLGYELPVAEPPRVTVLSPLSQTYNESSIRLVFTLNKQADWTGYSLNGQENVTIHGNVTLSGLSNGPHSLTVYANDTFGNMGVTENISFTVAVPKPVSPTLIIGSAVVAGAVAVLGLLVYLKKRYSLKSR